MKLDRKYNQGRAKKSIFLAFFSIKKEVNLQKF